jgi:hypothetical protein
MPSKLDVVNASLNELGRQAVQALDQSADSQILSAAVDGFMQELMTKTDWNFLIKFVKDNNPLSQSFSPDFVYSYQLPPDYARMDRFSPQSTNFGFYYRIIDGLLCTNSKPMQYYYVSNATDYSVITPLFFQALSLYLAFRRCMVITQDQNLTRTLSGLYMDKITAAILLNDMERYVETAPFNDYDRQTYI